MFYESAAAPTAELSLETVVARLAKQPEVRGLVVMGSEAAGTFNLHSDYDIFVVLANEAPAIHLIATIVDAHLAEFYFTSEAELDRVLSQAKLRVPDDSPEANLVRYVSTGRLEFDPTGKLAQLRELAQSQGWYEPQMRDETSIYLEWFRINYSVAHLKRYLASPDPIYQMTVDFRLLYGAMDVLLAYHRVRKLPWRGEKAAIRYLSEYDQLFLETFSLYFAETQREPKVRLYVKLAELALAPVGELWQAAATAVQFADSVSVQDHTIEAALGFWQTLVGA